MTPIDVDVVPQFNSSVSERNNRNLFVVIDVLRCSTSICFALAAGARRVVPFRETSQAVQFRDRQKAGTTLLCGEERGRVIPGFDLGNSPAEFGTAVAGKTLAMRTTNGTRAILGCPDGAEVLIGGFVNATSVVSRLDREGRQVTIVCAGWEGGFAAEDFLCAGLFCSALRHSAGATLSESAEAARVFYDACAPDLLETVKRTEGARRLVERGFGADIKICVARDTKNILPGVK